MGERKIMTGRLPRVFLIASFFTLLLLLYGNPALAANSPIQIASGPVSQGRPDVHGNIVTWKRLQGGSFDIFMNNLSTNTEQLVDSYPSDENIPVTNGGMILWMDNRSGNYDIYMKDLFLGITQPLVTGPGNQGVPAVSGNTVVYTNDRSGNNDIYAIDLTTRVIQPVCVNPADQWQPRISGTRVVWQDNRNGHYDIFMKDLATGIEQQVTSSPGNDKVADISGNIVVWQRTVGSVSDIWMKKLSTGIEQAVSLSSPFQNSPRISGDLVVWEDYRAGNYDLYIKDLTSGVERPLATGPSTQARPALDRDKAVWEDYSSAGVYTIWLETIPDTTPPAISNLSPADGTNTGCTSPVISATYSDNRTGVDTGSVQLTVDGQDVTASASVIAGSVSYQASFLGDGKHSATVKVADVSGNTSSATWQFQTSPPALGLNAQTPFWGSYSDYLDQKLTVPYQLANNSADTAVAKVEILAASASSGVIAASALPLSLGDIQPASKSGFALKFLIPGGLQSFKTEIYASGVDPCGDVHYIPGPPP